MAGSFSLQSSDIKNGDFLTQSQVFQGFGCKGDNLSPQLSWRGAPDGTKAFAVIAYDPDAPTGSGWWHWQVVNIPATVTSLQTGAGKLGNELLPAGAKQLRNDFGTNDFGGACPPKGHGVHRYQFTVHALSKPLNIPEGASAALAGYMIHANSLASSSIESLYRRD
ncbi:YbhB/YbcL family Raf kinase inhibitor-like protein [Pseudoalteromonas sp. R3]|nr:YbhB/YbcL family Raf kinase inhibitor-like protein [Pseudoalteromonas sp. R3]